MVEGPALWAIRGSRHRRSHGWGEARNGGFRIIGINCQDVAGIEDSFE
jgi:hypothetical protein